MDEITIKLTKQERETLNCALDALGVDLEWLVMAVVKSVNAEYVAAQKAGLEDFISALIGDNDTLRADLRREH